jgi:zinc D-Ala-D-Ala carboxypeptidase
MSTKSNFKRASLGLAGLCLVVGLHSNSILQSTGLTQSSNSLIATAQPLDNSGKPLNPDVMKSELLSFFPEAQSAAHQNVSDSSVQTYAMEATEAVVPKSPIPIAIIPAPKPASSTVVKAPSLAPKISVAKPVERKFGHFPYQEANPNNLIGVGQSQRMTTQAGTAFLAMAKDARQAGVRLFPISGFRNRGVQSELFAAQTARRGSQAAAARISAPPGHSEHHTGHVLDIGDETAPQHDLEESFVNTKAFRWLKQNASRYGFEQSFLPNNQQGVMHEPWHWRFVGDEQAQRVFESSRTSEGRQARAY